MEPILKGVASVFIAYTAHYTSVKAYNYMCVPDGFMGYMSGIVSMGSPVSTADSITAVTILNENITVGEEAFWSPVYAYDYEDEQNELKKYIKMVKSGYLSDVEKSFIEQLKQ